MRHLKETALRPQLRRRTSTILLSAIAAAALGAAGCSSVSNEIAVQTPATVAPNAGAAPILSAYSQFMKAYVVAYDTGNPNYKTFLTLGGGNGGGMRSQLVTAAAAGVTATYGPGPRPNSAPPFEGEKPSWTSPSVQYVDGNQTIASVTFCFNPAQWRTVDKDRNQVQDPALIAPATQASAPPSSAASQPSDNVPGSSAHPPHPAFLGDVVGAYTVLMLLNRDAQGQWLVAQTNAQPDRPCTPGPTTNGSTP